MSMLLPEVLGVRRHEGNDARVVVELRVPAALVHFAHHFPGLPLLPGVVQIDWAVRYAREHLPVDGDFTALENIKFQAPVLPGERLELALDWDAATARLAFAYTGGRRKFASGRIVLGGAA